MSDLISRQAVLNHIAMQKGYIDKGICGYWFKTENEEGRVVIFDPSKYTIVKKE